MPSESKLSSLCVLAIYYIKYIILNNASITEPIGLSKLLLLLDGVILYCILYYIHFCYLGTAKALYLLGARGSGHEVRGSGSGLFYLPFLAAAAPPLLILTGSAIKL